MMLESIIQLLCEARRSIVFCLVFFLASLAAGVIAYNGVADDIPDLVESTYSGVITASTWETAMNIGGRNITATLITVFTGFLVLVPVLILFVNGFLAGIVGRYALSLGVDPTLLALGIIPHGIVEVPAFIISTAFGARVGWSLIFPGGLKRWQAVKSSFKKAAFIYLTIVLPLIILGALIEAHVSLALVA